MPFRLIIVAPELIRLSGTYPCPSAGVIKDQFRHLSPAILSPKQFPACCLQPGRPGMKPPHHRPPAVAHYRRGSPARCEHLSHRLCRRPSCFVLRASGFVTSPWLSTLGGPDYELLSLSTVDDAKWHSRQEWNWRLSPSDRLKDSRRSGQGQPDCVAHPLNPRSAARQWGYTLPQDLDYMLVRERVNGVPLL
jgi:hypothetical protein